MIALLHGVVQGGWPEEGNALRAVASAGLSLLYAEVPAPPELPMPQSALAFHRAQQEILRERDLVPFRFPTLLAGDELRAHLATHAAQYHTALDRVAGCVQMEIEIEMLIEAAGAPASGTAYLRAKAERANSLQTACESVKRLAGPQVRAWRRRERKHGERLYGLAQRTAIAGLREGFAHCELDGCSVRLTGPWPATEFMELEELNRNTEFETSGPKGR